MQSAVRMQEGRGVKKLELRTHLNQCFFWVNFHGVAKTGNDPNRTLAGRLNQIWLQAKYESNIFYNTLFFNVLGTTLYLNHVKKSSGFFFFFFLNLNFVQIIMAIENLKKWFSKSLI
jgi:hypothetical protein